MEKIYIDRLFDLPQYCILKIMSKFCVGIGCFILGIFLSFLTHSLSSIFLFFALGILFIIYGYYILYKIKRDGLIKADFYIDKKTGYYEKSFTRFKFFEVYGGIPKLIVRKEFEIDDTLYRIHATILLSAIQWKKFSVNDHISITYYEKDMQHIGDNSYVLNELYAISLF